MRNRLLKPRPRYCHAVLWLAVVLATSGCQDQKKIAAERNQAIETALANRNLQHQRDLQQATKAAAAEAEADALKAAQQAAADARTDGFRSGELAGKAAVREEFDTKVELERNKAFDQGKAIGHSEASVTYFEKGKLLGEQTGRINGKAEAEEKLRLASELAVQEAKAEAEKLGRLEGIEEGRQQAKRHSLLEKSILGICVAVFMTVLGFYLLLRRQVSQQPYVIVQSSHRVADEAPLTSYFISPAPTEQPEIIERRVS
ncbi:hypothetical protein [Fuerstiella marisgermanici]|uniref:Uncharacterized protein n=1 Tax=Fuerstiella marisgermanici TaxID=1891926 RepID=A0A1P8WP68_9PLAN|nr:hypothetical protein [Fuerstiella marisgermanici]APZ95850.1 hypothetical protein Fuma_05513 [Fuerstiella marisgermanici]